MERNAFAVAESASGPYVSHSSTPPRRRALPETARHDLYRNIHAGLRMCMGDALSAVGRMDADDPSDVAAVTLQMNELITLFRGHLEKENAWVHPALEARQPGSTARIAHDHDDHVAAFARLADDVLALRTAPSPRRSGAARTLYRDLAAFVADNLAHMAAEETDHNAVLWSTHSDEELVGIERAIVGSIAPPLKSAYMRWIVPAIPHAERVAMMSALRAAAPAEAFDATLAMLKPHLAHRDWAKLVAALTSGIAVR
jgi:Hemerythrin HHE cation binding domain